MKNLVLIGMPGSGKTTLAGRLSIALGMEAVDIDGLIERAAGMPISEIFARHGEPYFRGLEAKLTAEAAGREGAILSTGGGVVLREENMDALRETGIVFFLDRPPGAIAASRGHEHRPLVGGDRARIFELYQARIGLYRSYAHCTVENCGTIETALAELIHLWEELK